jgi:O-antigen/teichoic acid export membrane protein
LGLNQIVIRELSKFPEKSNELLGTGFVLRFFGFGILIAVMVITLQFMGNDPYTNTLILIIAASEIFKTFEVIDWFYQSKVMSKYVVRVQLVVNLVISVTKIGMVFWGAPLVWFAAIVLVNTFLNAAGYLLTYWKREGTLRNWKFRKNVGLLLMRESWPLALHGLALHTQARIDQVMLGKMLNNYEVGQYSVALKLIEVLGFIPMVIMSTFVPAITKAKEISKALYHDRLLNFYRLMFGIFLVVAFPLYFLAEDVIIFLYGAEYQAAGFLLSLFAIRLFYTNMGVAKSAFILNESLFKYSLLTTIIGAISNITINYLLIPVFASAGAIIATILSFTISIFLIDFFYHKTRQNQKLIFKGITSFWRLKEIMTKF